MPKGAVVNILSNDGAELLGAVESTFYDGAFLNIRVFYNGEFKRIASHFTGSPVESGFDLTPYAGVADAPNASVPTYEDGYDFSNSGTYTVYVVPAGGWRHA